MHVYRCAECGERFETEGHANRCPRCRGKVLVHLEGEPRRRKCGCGSGSCSGSCSCCGH